MLLVVAEKEGQLAVAETDSVPVSVADWEAVAQCVPVSEAEGEDVSEAHSVELLEVVGDPDALVLRLA